MVHNTSAERTESNRAAGASPLPNVTVIIPQKNHTHLTRQCIETLMEVHSQPPRVTVVDDGSHVRELRDFQSWSATYGLTLLCQRESGGVTRAWNRAAQHAGKGILIFLNNDCLSRDAWIDDLCRPLHSQPNQIVGIRQRTEVVPAASDCETHGCATVLEGWCLAMPYALWNSQGGFDESMRIWFSDTDLQLRLMERFGERALRAFPDAPLEHLRRQTSRYREDRSAQWLADRRAFLAALAHRRRKSRGREYREGP